MKTLQRVWLNCIQLVTLIVLTTSASAQLKADFSATPQTGCPPMVVSFKDLSTGNPTQWKWDLGNGTISFLQHPIATYFNPGKYTIKLVVKTNTGADSVVKSQFITVNALPTPNFGVSDSTGCFPLTVKFTDSSLAGSGNIVKWEWDFGDGTLSTQKNPAHTYTNGGSFSVKLRVTNSNGCVKVITRPDLIKLVNGVKADFSFIALQSCVAPSIVTFTNTSTGTGLLNYKWEFGNGNTSTLEDPSENYTTPGKYTVKLVATNSIGCSDTMVKANAINISFAQAGFTMPDKVCAGQSFNLTNTTSPAPVSSQWLFNDGTSVTTKNATKSFNSAGIYTITLVANFGGCSDTVSKSIEVTPRPSVGFTVANGNSCKVPLPVVFTNTTTNGVDYLWNFGDGTTSTQVNPTHTYTRFGNFNVTLVVTNNNGCKDTLVQSKAVTIVPPKISGLTGLPASGCLPLTINPTAKLQIAGTVQSYLWNFGDGTTSTDAQPTHVYTQPGIYNVKLTIVTSEGCTDSLTVSKAVSAGNKPATQFVADPLDACAEVNINFADLTSNVEIHEWFWKFGDGGTSILKDPKHQYKDTGRFNVTLITSSFGCYDTLVKEKYLRIRPPVAKFDTSFLCTDRLTRKFIDKSISAERWSWSFGDGATSNEQSPVHTYAKTGEYTIQLVVTNGICEHKSVRKFKVVKESPVFTNEDSATCRNTLTAFNVTNVNQAFIRNYTWFPMGANTTPVVNTSATYRQTYSRAGEVSPMVIVTDAVGCKDTFSVTLPIKIHGPTADFSLPYDGTCLMSKVDFTSNSTDDGLHPITQYTWNFGDKTVQNYTSAPFSHVYAATGVYGVSLIVKDSYGCVDTITKPNMLTISQPVANFTVSDTMVCPGTDVKFTNKSTGLNLKYSWNFGDNTASTTTSPSHKFPAEGSFGVLLLATDKFGCEDTATAQVKIVKTASDFVMSDSFSSCPPLLVDFSDRSKGHTVLSWNFGDNGVSNLQAPSHMYTYPGTYLVKLAVRNNTGCVDTTTKKIIINGPTGTFTYSPTVECSRAQVSFVATTKNTVRYIWDYNDGTTVFGTSTTNFHVYNKAGIFVPKMILQDNAGCQVPIIGKDTIKINGVETFINAGFGASDVVLCDNGTVSFTDSTVSNDVIKGFLWSFGDGKTSTQRNPTHFFSDTGRYIIKLIATTQFGCADTSTLQKVVKVVSSPVIKIVGDTAACEPSVLKFTAGFVKTDTSAVKWSWSFGNGLVSTLQEPAAQQYLTAGNYPVQLIAVNSSGCADTVTRKAIIHPLPKVHAGLDTFVCRYSPITLRATGAATYSWSFAPSLSCLNCASPVAKPSVSTQYIVTGKTQFGCVAKDTLLVQVKQPFELTVSKDDTICIGEKVKMQATGAAFYNWYPAVDLDNPLAANPVATPDSTITYMVVAKDSNNCFEDTGFVKVKVYPIPEIEIAGGDQLSVNVGSSVRLRTTRSNDVSQVRWMPATGLNCTNCFEPVATPRESVTYSVVASNEGNCVSRDQITLNVICNNANIYVPNSFSPNGDGSNDQFFPRGNGVFSIKAFRIFNRWGQVVFQSNNIGANNAFEGWDGTINGVKAEPAVYVYMLEVLCENNVVFPLKGNVTLIR